MTVQDIAPFSKDLEAAASNAYRGLTSWKLGNSPPYKLGFVDGAHWAQKWQQEQDAALMDRMAARSEELKRENEALWARIRELEGWGTWGNSPYRSPKEFREDIERITREIVERVGAASST